ncbi:hypothetical protein [Erwinia rhapontici]|uniref:hypothetical protein n=1 Tax=Erwinia rhapontici TaxID=55212 RepID=UPI0013313943|nr:hypothetical protein [Erwinia rhapontici]MBP2157140.1 hypothetical protein [Erwinia rhapontici]
MDWFDKNATALIAAGSALLAACIAGIFNLINTANNQSIFKAQMIRDEAKDTKRLYLEKGEELHTLLTKWGNLSFASFHYDLSYISGELGNNYKNDVLQNQFDVNTYTRLSALINIYFPDLLPFFEKSRLSALNTAEIIRKYVKEEISRVKALEEYNNNVRIHQAYLEKILGDLQVDLLKKLQSEPS